MKKLKPKVFKIYAVVIAVLIVISSCSTGDRLKNENIFKNYHIITIDNCQYIQYGTAYGYLEITHKGDCPNHK
jgi:hypothetical protein